MAIEIYVHKMTEHMETAKILRWLVAPGEVVVSGQAILEVETDKAVVELEAPASGVLKGIRPGVAEGAEVRVGATIAFIAEPNEEVPSLEPLAAPNVLPETDQVRGAAGEGSLRAFNLRATPVARRVARELAVELHLVRGTGRDGCIREEDVRGFAEQRGQVPSGTVASTAHPPPPRGVGTVPGQAGTWMDLSPAQRLTGKRMLESVQAAPQFVLSVDIDMSRVIDLRSVSDQGLASGESGPVSITSVLVKATALTLKKHPRLNASYADGRILLYEPVNVGVAVGSDAGLIVPVVLSADEKSLAQIDLEIRAFQEKAKRTRFSDRDLTGGTFTISNLGMFGVDRFDAIINPPQSAILAMGRIRKVPVLSGEDRLLARPMATLSLTIDHRVMDGLHGAHFLGDLKAILEEPGALADSAGTAGAQ
jgi:pyruvate dehydrogenase E2 component (dihydrolipoamide acetyltransferase)